MQNHAPEATKVCIAVVSVLRARFLPFPQKPIDYLRDSFYLAAMAQAIRSVGALQFSL